EALHPLGRRLVRRVAGPEAEVHEKGLRRVDGSRVGDHLLGLVDEVLGQVVALLPRARRVDLVVVADEGGRELVGLAAEEAIPALEATSQWPRGPGAGLVGLLFGCEVP